MHRALVLLGVLRRAPHHRALRISPKLPTCAARTASARLARTAPATPAPLLGCCCICTAYALYLHCICTAALEMRKMMLELEVSSGKIEMPAYLARVAASLEAEKTAARGHKAAGQTALALHAMKRAKIMSDEIAAARATEAE